MALHTSSSSLNEVSLPPGWEEACSPGHLPSDLPTREASQKDPIVAALPLGWDIRSDDQGRTFDADNYARTTTWDEPPTPSLPPGWETRATQRNRVYYVHAPTRDVTWTEPGCADLPVGWERRVDMDKKRIYFVNHNTRTTTWDDPRVDAEELKASKTRQRNPFRWSFVSKFT